MKNIRVKPPHEHKKYKFGGFDIETWGLNPNKFAFGVVGYQLKNQKIEYKTFFDKDAMFNFMIDKRFKHYNWYAHNGGKFDLIGLLGNYLENPDFHVILNSGRLIKLTYNSKISFLDSLNLFPVSLELIGKALKKSKGKTPEKFIKGSKTDITETDINYCKRDVEILIESIIKFNHYCFIQYGTNIGLTIASTSQKVFLTSYLEKDIKVKSEHDKVFRNSYFGGRTEVIEGKDQTIYPAIYHDFNSLYPSVMLNGKYPDPENFKHLNRLKTDISYIKKYEGVSEVSIYIPDMKYPPLPYKLESKLIFPVGVIRGYYNHNELRTALKYNCKIEKIYNTIYSETTISPFKSFVNHMYQKRIEHKKDNDKMGDIYTKLLMNSLYGKFAQKLEKREQGFIFKPPNSKNYKWEFQPYKNSDVGQWVAKDENGKVIFSEGYNNIISFASYTTSMARIKLFEAVQEVYTKGGTVYYTDTDSIISNIEIENSKELGKLKIEKQGILEAKAPKVYQFYEVTDFSKLTNIEKYKQQVKPDIKLKGISKKYVSDKIHESYDITKLLTVKEALKRGLKAGQPEKMVKKISNQDTKRIWEKGKSKPININEIENIKTTIVNQKQQSSYIIEEINRSYNLYKEMWQKDHICERATTNETYNNEITFAKGFRVFSDEALQQYYEINGYTSLSEVKTLLIALALRDNQITEEEYQKYLKIYNKKIRKKDIKFEKLISNLQNKSKI